MKHIEILHSGSTYDGHWVCCYYNTKQIIIYDSLNSKKLHADHDIYIKKLFPFHNFENEPIQFPTVQGQPNGYDCGVFAIAFAVSILYELRPETIRYKHSFMRQHLIDMFQSNTIDHFPQDAHYKVPQDISSFQHLHPINAKTAGERDSHRYTVKETNENHCSIDVLSRTDTRLDNTIPLNNNINT